MPRFHCHGQRVHERLRVCAPNIGQEGMDRCLNPPVRLVDAGNELRYDLEPCVDTDMRESLGDGSDDLLMAAIGEP